MPAARAHGTASPYQSIQRDSKRVGPFRSDFARGLEERESWSVPLSKAPPGATHGAEVGSLSEGVCVPEANNSQPWRRNAPRELERVHHRAHLQGVSTATGDPYLRPPPRRRAKDACPRRYAPLERGILRLGGPCSRRRQRLRNEHRVELRSEVPTASSLWAVHELQHRSAGGRKGAGGKTGTEAHWASIELTHQHQHNHPHREGRGDRRGRGRE